ncbi:MAG: hypothetical protein ACR2JQ_10985, partial [Mycobacteriales bacterium]
MFRYAIGGAIGVRGASYVDFLVPGFVVSGLIFTAGGSAVAVAEDAASGLRPPASTTVSARCPLPTPPFSPAAYWSTLRS